MSSLTWASLKSSSKKGVRGFMSPSPLFATIASQEAREMDGRWMRLSILLCFRDSDQDQDQDQDQDLVAYVLKDLTMIIIIRYCLDTGVDVV